MQLLGVILFFLSYWLSCSFNLDVEKKKEIFLNFIKSFPPVLPD